MYPLKLGIDKENIRQDLLSTDRPGLSANHGKIENTFILAIHMQKCIEFVIIKGGNRTGCQAKVFCGKEQVLTDMGDIY